MSLDAIEAISEAEENAKKRIAAAKQEAKRSLAEAEAAGKAAIEAARKKAADELSALSAKADEKAKSDALELASATENKKSTLRVKAENSLDQAAELIVERIVKS